MVFLSVFLSVFLAAFLSLCGPSCWQFRLYVVNLGSVSKIRNALKSTTSTQKSSLLILKTQCSIRTAKGNKTSQLRSRLLIVNVRNIHDEKNFKVFASEKLELSYLTKQTLTNFLFARAQRGGRLLCSSEEVCWTSSSSG